MAARLDMFEVTVGVLQAIDEGADTVRKIEASALVSQTTVRRVLRNLRDGGYVEGELGKDTFGLTPLGLHIIEPLERERRNPPGAPESAGVLRT